MKLRTRTMERLRDALLHSGRKESAVLSSAYETLARQGLLSTKEQEALSRVDTIAETMFLMMAADELITDTELDALRGAIRGLTGDILGDGVIKVMLETYALRLRDEGRTARLQTLAQTLLADPAEAENAFSLAAAVALADDQVDASEDSLLQELASWLGFDEARAQALLDKLNEEQQSDEAS